MEIARAEVDERLQRADELRRLLRRATRELGEFGRKLLDERKQKKDRGDADDRSR